MASVMERAAQSVNHMFSLYFTICNFSYFPFCMRGRNLGSDCSSHCILVTSEKVLMMIYFEGADYCCCFFQ